VKCDRRWWNDGRLERERDAFSRRDDATEDEAREVLDRMSATLRAMGIDRGHCTVRRSGAGFNVSFTPPGVQLRVSLP
jgi:hypothetical protein